MPASALQHSVVMWRTEDRNLRKLQRSSRCNTHLQQAICTATRRCDARVAAATPMVATLLLRDEHVAAAAHWTSVALARPGTGPARPAVRSIATNACCTPSGAGSTPGGASLHRCSDACARAARRVEQLRSSPKAVRLGQTNKQTNKPACCLPLRWRARAIRERIGRTAKACAVGRQQAAVHHSAHRCCANKGALRCGCCANKCALRCGCCVASVALRDSTDVACQDPVTAHDAGCPHHAGTTSARSHSGLTCSDLRSLAVGRWSPTYTCSRFGPFPLRSTVAAVHTAYPALASPCRYRVQRSARACVRAIAVRPRCPALRCTYAVQR